jgi:hypothetical protein
VEREAVGLQRRWSLGHEVRDVPVAADPVVHAKPDALHGEVGFERLRRGWERHALAAKPGRQIFGSRSPVAGDRDLHADACCPPQSPQQLGVHGPRGSETVKGISGNLGPRHRIIGPGQSCRSIEEKMVERIADAGANRAIVHDRLAVGHLAVQGQVDRLAAAHRIGNQHVRIRSTGVSLKSQHQARWSNVVVSALQPKEIAAGASHEIEIERKIE